MIIWQEARGEPPEGRRAVAEVIRNRMKRKYQSDGTVAGTVLRPYQFSGMNTQDPNRRLAAVIDDDDAIVKDCLKAWHEAETTTYAKGSVLYYNPKAVTHDPPWLGACHRVAIVGAHHFYDTGED